MRSDMGRIGSLREPDSGHARLALWGTRTCHHRNDKPGTRPTRRCGRYQPLPGGATWHRQADRKRQKGNEMKKKILPDMNDVRLTSKNRPECVDKIPRRVLFSTQGSTGWRRRRDISTHKGNNL